jgi:pyrophosphatase PpaX
VAIDTGLTGVTAVLFDFDGTLFHLDTDLDHWRSSARRFLAPSLQGLSQVDDIVAAVDVIHRAEVLDALASAEAEGLRGGGPVPGAGAVVSFLRRHLSVAVVSRNLRPTLDAGLRSLGLDGLVVVSREDTGRPKPDPAPFRLALAALGVGVGGAVVVGDTSHDVDGARACGARSVLVANPRLAYRPVGADVTVQCLAELPELFGLTRVTKEVSRSRQ